MEYRPLEITVMSADGIKDVNVFGKMDVYAVVSILGYPRAKKKTEVDMNCGTSPRWNHKMQLAIDERSLSNPNLFILIQLKAEKSIGDRHIGEVSVPIPELFENDKATAKEKDAAQRVVEYQVKTSSGRPKGTLKFSYNFGGKCSYGNNAETKKTGEPVTMSPAGNGHEQAGSSMPAIGYPSYPAPGMGYPGMGAPGYQQMPPGTEPPGYQQPPPGIGSPRYQQPPPGMGWPGYQQLPPGRYPGHPPSQGYGAYPPSGGYLPPGYRYPPPPGYRYQQPV